MAISAVTLPEASSLPPRGPARLLRSARVIHPFPTLLNVAATAGLAFVAAGGSPDISLVTRMLLVMFFAQSAIGVVNDVCDEDLDAAVKPWKPIPAGLVSPRAARVLGVACIAAAMALATTLGPSSFVLAMLGMSCGLAYDLRLKRSVLSALPYMVAIPTLPIWVWTTLGLWQPELLWLLPLGALLGLSLHLANTLPDIDDDAAHGVTGLAHRLGARASMLVTWLSFALALALSALIAPVVGYELRFYLPGLLAGAFCLVASIALYARWRSALALQLGFGLLAIGSAVVAVGWLAAVT